MRIATHGRLLTLAAAVLFSTGGVALKAEAFQAAQMSALRSGVAVIVLLLWMRGRVTWSPAILGMGSLYAATVTLFVAATKLTTAAAAILLQSAAPLYIALLGPVLLGERFTRRGAWWLPVIGAGLWLCAAATPAASATAPDPATGNLLGMASGVTWALTLISLRFLERGPRGAGTGLSAVVAGNAIACAVALPFAGPWPAAPLADWANVVYLGAGQIALAYICLTHAARQVPAFEMSLILLVEPVLNPLWTWWLRGEEPGVPAIVGGALILGATALRTLQAANDLRAAAHDVAR